MAKETLVADSHAYNFSDSGFLNFIYRFISTCPDNLSVNLAFIMRKIWTVWKKITQKIGNFQSRIIFSLLYFILVTPLGLLVSLFKDYLFKDTNSWQDIDDHFSTLEKISKQ